MCIVLYDYVAFLRACLTYNVSVTVTGGQAGWNMFSEWRFFFVNTEHNETDDNKRVYYKVILFCWISNVSMKNVALLKLQIYLNELLNTCVGLLFAFWTIG